MDYGFDLNSQESIAFANVIMDNDDSNLAGIKSIKIKKNEIDMYRRKKNILFLIVIF